MSFSSYKSEETRRKRFFKMRQVELVLIGVFSEKQLSFSKSINFPGGKESGSRVVVVVGWVYKC